MLHFISFHVCCFVRVFRDEMQMDVLGWWRGVAVTRFIRSTKLLYAGPG